MVCLHGHQLIVLLEQQPKCSAVQICTAKNLGTKQYWAMKNRELSPIWRLTNTSRWTGQFLKQMSDGWSSHWNIWPKCHLGWTHAPAQWHQQSTPNERQHTILHCWVHCLITSGKVSCETCKGELLLDPTDAHASQLSVGPLCVKFTAFKQRGGLVFPSTAVYCCQVYWISFLQTCCGCRYKCIKWKEHWLEDPKYHLWTNVHKGVFHQPCSFLWPQARRRKGLHIFFAETGHFKIPAPEADSMQ